jgi:hypothetical protein
MDFAELARRRYDGLRSLRARMSLERAAAYLRYEGDQWLQGEARAACDDALDIINGRINHLWSEDQRRRRRYAQPPDIGADVPGGGAV